MVTVTTTVYCCSAATPVFTASSNKLHYDPNRELHETIFRSFIAFAIRQHQEVERLAILRLQEEERLEQERIKTQELMRLLMGAMKENPCPSTPHSHSSTPVSFSPGYGHASNLASSQPPPPSGLASALATIQDQRTPAPLFTYENLQNNPLSDQTPYVIHLTSRYDFGPVYSDRYFICPDNLSDDWIECSMVHWYAQGTPFAMKAEKWDLKCYDHKRFFRMTLRPNLCLRGRYSPAPISKQLSVQYPVMKYVAHPVAGHRTGVAEGGVMMGPAVAEPSLNMEGVLYFGHGMGGAEGGFVMPLAEAEPNLNMEQGSSSGGESGTDEGSEVVVKWQCWVGRDHDAK